MNYKLLKISSYYRNFIISFQEKYPELSTLPYGKQYELLMAEKYGWADFFKFHLEKAGTQVFEVVPNAITLQNAWSLENCGEIKADILFEQIKYFKPDVIFIQDIKNFTNEYLQKLKSSFSFIKLITGHICAPMSQTEMDNFKTYDFLFTCLPTFSQQLTNIGIKNYMVSHGFETSIIENINSDNKFEENDLIFIGSFVKSTDFHDERMKYIEAFLNEKINLKIYGNIQYDSLLTISAKQTAFIAAKSLKKIGFGKINQKVNALKKSASLTEFPKRFHFSENFKNHVVNKSYYGIEMYKLLSRAKIGFNIHGGIAGNYAANVRLFETTGVGSLLLTDYKQNIKDFYEPDFEIVTYKSIDECIEKIKWLENNPNEVEKIRKAGQQRCMKSHTLESRIRFMDEKIQENLIYKKH